MKRVIYLTIPLIAISLLVNCNKKSESTYEITFNCIDCNAYDENDKEITSVKVSGVNPNHSLYKEFRFKNSHPFRIPSKSDITINETGTDKVIEYEYANGNIFVPVVGNLTITARGSAYSKSLENSSWSEIAEIAATNRADEFFKVGDTKKVRLNGQDFDHTARIIDFNRDDLADGSGKKAGITFEFENLITKSNKTEAYTSVWDSANNYDYRNSVINNFLNDETNGAESIINLLPDDLNKEGIIEPVDKLVGVNKTKVEGTKNYKATSFETGKYPKLFLLAYNEMHDFDGELVTPDETNKIYKYYEGHGGDTSDDWAYRVKRIVGDTSTEGEDYWLRSPNTFSGIIAEIVHIGFIDVRGVNNAFAVAPAFCI